jgi:hypothetical protein
VNAWENEHWDIDIFWVSGFGLCRRFLMDIVRREQSRP